MLYSQFTTPIEMEVLTTRSSTLSSSVDQLVQHQAAKLLLKHFLKSFATNLLPEEHVALLALASNLGLWTIITASL